LRGRPLAIRSKFVKPSSSALTTAAEEVCAMRIRKEAQKTRRERVEYIVMTGNLGNASYAT
jgi:hypothetical protein